MDGVRFLDLFAGCGGLSLGFEYAGLELATAVELSPMAAETHFRNFHLRNESWDENLWKQVLESSESGEDGKKTFTKQIRQDALITHGNDVAHIGDPEGNNSTTRLGNATLLD